MMRMGIANASLLLSLGIVGTCACSSDAIGPARSAGAGAGGTGQGGAGGGPRSGDAGGVSSSGSAGTLGTSGAAGNPGLAGNAGSPGGAGNAGSPGGAGSAGSPGGAGQGNGGAGPLGPHFIGRFDQSKADAPVFAWPGTAIALRFTGTEVGVTLTDGGTNVFEVVLDGKHTVLTLQAGTKKYALGSGLAAGAHDLLLYRRTEASFNETTFNGFDVAASAYLPATLPTRRLEVIGDSISAGYGNEGTYPCTFSAATENHYLSYEALAARAVNAELYTEAWSGIGMLRNYGGDTMNVMPDRYPRTLPDRATSVWDFGKFVPDAVVINLGTNDFSTDDPGAPFQAAYLKFVSDLRGHYPAARFFLALGPMLSGDSYTKAAAYLKAVIADRASAGDKNLTLLDFGIQDTNADGLGCDYHPSLKTHQKMADKLQAALKADLAW